MGVRGVEWLEYKQIGFLGPASITDFSIKWCVPGCSPHPLQYTNLSIHKTVIFFSFELEYIFKNVIDFFLSMILDTIDGRNQTLHTHWRYSLCVTLGKQCKFVSLWPDSLKWISPHCTAPSTDRLLDTGHRIGDKLVPSSLSLSQISTFISIIVYYMLSISFYCTAQFQTSSRC